MLTHSRRALFAALSLSLAASSARADLLIGDPAHNNVLRYSDSGAFLSTLVSSGSGGLDHPGGLAVGPDGYLYVASRGTSQILRYQSTTGAFVGSFATASSGAYTALQFYNGTLYAARNDFSGAIDLFNPATATLTNSFVPSSPPLLNQALYIDIGASGLAISTDTSRFFILDPLTGAQIYTTTIDTIHGTAFDAAGNQYLAKSDGQNVMRRLAAGGLFTDFLPPFTITGSDIAFGPDGNLYVLANDRVARYDGLTGLFIDNLVSPGSGGLTGGQYFAFVAPVPEPSTLGLLAAAALFLLVRRRRALLRSIATLR